VRRLRYVHKDHSHCIHAVDDQIEDDLLKLDPIASDAQLAARSADKARTLRAEACTRRNLKASLMIWLRSMSTVLNGRSFQETAQTADHFAGTLIVALDVGKDSLISPRSGFANSGSVRRSRHW